MGQISLQNPTEGDSGGLDFADKFELMPMLQQPKKGSGSLRVLTMPLSLLDSERDLPIKIPSRVMNSGGPGDIPAKK